MSSRFSKNFISDGMQKNIEDLISNLIFISKIQVNEVLDVESMTLMKVGWMTTFYRTFYTNENRYKTLNFLKDIVNEAENISSTYIQNSDIYTRKIGYTILESLDKSKNGIINICKTYETDRMFVSKVETLLNRIDTNISQIKEMGNISDEDISGSSPPNIIPHPKNFN